MRKTFKLLLCVAVAIVCTTGSFVAHGQNIVETIAGNGTAGFLGDGGQAKLAEINQPEGIYVDAAGNIYFCDDVNSRIRKIDPTGVITTVAGNGVIGYVTDGVAATSTPINNPFSVITDGAGNIIFTDCHNHRVRKINTSGIISTIAGNGTAAYLGNGIPATNAEMNEPAGIAMDASGNIYIGDLLNQCIRKIDPSGIITTIAGTPLSAGFSGDGGLATNATMNQPNFVHVDLSGNVIITDNSNYCIRKINMTTHIITTIAGIGTSPGYSGDGGPATSAKLHFPGGVNFDALGNMYIADAAANDVIRVVNTSGIINPYAGIGLTGGFYGDGGQPQFAKFSIPVDIAFDPNGNLDIADQANHRIRQILPDHAPHFTGGATQTMHVCENSFADSINLLLQVIDSDALQHMVWSVFSGPSHGTVAGSYSMISTGGLLNPHSFFYTPTGGYTGTDVFSIAVTDSYKTDITTITVTVDSVAPITPSSIGVCPGDSVQVSDATVGGTWSTANTTLISIDASGEVTGIATGGSPLITYTSPTGCSVTHGVFVFPPPAAITPSTAVLCAGTSVNLSDATSGGTWASSATTIATVGTSGKVTGVSGGTATISYTAGSGSCFALATVTVNPQPLDIGPPGPLTICLFSTSQLSDATSGGTWSSSTTTVATIGTSGIVTGAGVGTSTITYTNGFGCIKTKTVTVLNAPAAITPSSASLCAGSTTNLSDATSGGIWTSSLTTVATVGTSGVVFGAGAGTSTIVYSIGSCHTNATVTVNALPNAGTITGVSSVCAGSVAPLTDAAGGGVWTSINTSVATVGGTGVVNGVSIGTTTISYTVVGPFCTAAATKIITVNPQPSAGTIIGPVHVCQGSTISLTDAAGGGVWTSTSTSVSTVSALGVVTGVTLGSDDIIYTVTNGFGCSNSTFIPDTVVLAPNSISGTPTVCIGSASILTDGVLGGTWSSSSTSVASVGTSGVVTGLTVGTTTITYALSSGCSVNLVVTVIASPAAISPASATVCLGSTVLLSDATGGGTWASANTTVATVVGGLVSGLTLGTTTITYTVGGCFATAPVTVNPVPAAITPAGAISICQGTSTALTDATGGGVWSSSATTIATVGTGGSVTGVSAGVATISYTNLSGCSALKTITVNLAPTAISPLTATVCAGSTTSLTDAVGGGIWSSSNTNVAVSSGTVTGVVAGSSTITYSIGTCTTTATVTVNATPAAITPAGPVSVCAGGTTTLTDATPLGVWSSSATATATVIGGIVNGVSIGTVNISYTNGLSCSAIKSVTVISGPAAITPSSSTLCSGSSASLSDATGGGAWSSSNTNVSVTGLGAITGVAIGSSTITYTVGTCFTTATVTVITTPAAITPAGPVSICSGSTANLSDATGGGIWSSGATTIATVGGTGIVSGVSAGTATISYTSGGCSVSKTVTVITGPAAIIPSSFTLCTGKTFTPFESTGGGVWTSSSTTVATVGTGGTVTGVTTGTATISYTVGSCSSIATVTVNLSPSAGVITGPATVCLGSTINLTDAAGGGVWSSTNSAVATVSGIGLVNGLTAGTTTISYSVTNGCGTVAATTTITVNSSPTAGVITGASSVCAGTFTLLTDATTGGTWASSNTSIATISATGLLTGVSPGTATIAYTVTTPCGTATATKTITVGAFLSAGSITGATTMCAGTTISLTDPAIGGVWSASNADATVSGTGIVTGISGGIDTIMYTVTAICGSATATHTVLVNPLADAGSITGLSLICAGTFTFLSDAAVGGNWTSSNTLIATITPTALLTGIAPGTATISYTVSNICGPVSATHVVTVGTFISAGTITGATSVCAGSTIPLTDATAGGVWSSSNTSLATVGTTGLVSGIGGGIDTILYTVTLSCGSSSATHTVTVIPIPNAGSITGPGSVCSGVTITLSDAVLGGIWSASNGHATISGTGLVTAVSPGIDTMTYTVTNVCGTAKATKIINVGSALTAGSITGSGTICQGSSLTLSDAAPGGVWSSSNTSVAATGTSGIVTGISSGTATIVYTVSNVCGTVSATASVTVNPLPNAGAIIGTSSLCLGTSTNLSDAIVGGIWSASNGNATISGTGLVTSVSVGLDTMSYTVTNSCGTAAATLIMSISTTPTAGIITGPTDVCMGSSATLSDATTGGIWSSSNTSIATIGTSGIVSGMTIGTSTISYTVATGCGTAVSTAAIAVDLAPNAGSIIGPASICAGTFTIFTDAASGGVWSSSNTSATITPFGGVLDALVPFSIDTISYTVTNGCGTAVASKILSIGMFFTAGTITGPSNVCTGTTVSLTDATPGGVWSSGSTAVATIGTTGIVTGLTTGTTTIYYTITASCGIASATTTISVSPSPFAGSIVGSSTVCVGSLVALTDAATGGVWSSSTGNATITTGGVVTGVFAGTATINYTVTNSCGSAVASLLMTIGSAMSAGLITGPSAVCQGANITLSDAVTGGTWASTNTAIVTVGTSGVVTGVNPGTGVIVYSISTFCGVSNTTATITVNGLPNPGSITGPSGVCIGSSISLTDATGGGVWSAGNGNASVISGLVTGLAVGTDPISYSVTNGCGTSSAISIINISTTPVSGIISGPSSVCVGSGITLTDPVPGGIWLASNGHAIVAGPGVIDGVTVGIDSIFYQVSNACGTSVATDIIAVNPIPFVGPISGASEVCTGATTALTDGVAGGTWTSSASSVATVGAATGIVSGITTGATIISYTVTNIYGCPATALFNDTVVTTPVLPAITGSTNACIGSGTMLSDAFAGGTWTSSNTSIATINPVSGMLTGVSSGLVTITYTVINICGSATTTTTEAVNPLPVVAGITGSANVCVGATTLLNDATSGGVWASSNSAVATIDPTGTVTGVTAGTANMMYTVTNLFGCSATASQSETVNAAPVVAAISGATHQCVGTTMTLTDATGGGIWSSSNTAIAPVSGTGVVTGLTAGNAMIMYSVTGAGCTTTVLAADTVVALPFVAAISGSGNVCLGSSIPLTDAITGGVWSSSNTTIAVVSGSGTVTGLNTGSVSIMYSVTNAFGCNTTKSAGVTVNPIPSVTAITGAGSVCAGQNITLSDATAGGVWTSGNTTVATVDASLGIVTGVSAGTVSVIYTVTGIGGCTNGSMVAITVGSSLSSAFISPVGSATLCHGNTVTMTVTGSGITTYQWLHNGVVIPGATSATYTTNTSGVFSVTVNNGICGETLAGTTILAPPNPVILYTAPNELYTGSFSSYEWFLNGVLIPGANSSVLYEKAGGKYTVVVTDKNGCTDTSAMYIINGGTTGVNGVVNVDEIKVYPNPATSMLHIDAPVRVNISVLSVDGKVLLEQKDAANVDISRFANGLYMIMIYDENNLLLKTAKFTKAE